MGYGAQHAVFVFGRRKVEALDVEPTQPDQLGQEVRSNNRNLLQRMSYMYHAGMVVPKFAVTEIDGLDLVKTTIRVLFKKDPGDAWLTRAVRST